MWLRLLLSLSRAPSRVVLLRSLAAGLLTSTVVVCATTRSAIKGAVAFAYLIGARTAAVSYARAIESPSQLQRTAMVDAFDRRRIVAQQFDR
ncbi:unnamed protein product [Zymoseptoria tritici ST99CH_1E4]|uniref:Uncharacterized protein n=1 Tax=Zymoseptoria tritici ST99CH_1E4 TaxID=1276532 RepID=A0A2H1GUG8_ZYMTR|nr:unnamed protein product [Zymoseptoria tritici ST99CH_1E4]